MTDDVAVVLGLLAAMNVVTWAYVGGWGRRLERQVHRLAESRADGSTRDEPGINTV